MAKILIAYASMSGNTESIADLIKVSLDAFDHEVVLQEMEGMDAEELLAYDGIILDLIRGEMVNCHLKRKISMRT